MERSRIVKEPIPILYEGIEDPELVNILKTLYNSGKYQVELCFDYSMTPIEFRQKQMEYSKKLDLPINDCIAVDHTAVYYKWADDVSKSILRKKYEIIKDQERIKNKKTLDILE